MSKHKDERWVSEDGCTHACMRGHRAHRDCWCSPIWQDQLKVYLHNNYIRINGSWILNVRPT